MNDVAFFYGDGKVLGACSGSSLCIGGQKVGNLIGEPTVVTHDPPGREHVVFDPPSQLSLRFSASPMHQDAIDALALNFAELSPVAEKAAVVARDFAAKLRNLQFHTDGNGNECPGTAGCTGLFTVTGDLEALTFADPAKNRRYRRWKRSRMLRNCRERERNWRARRAVLEANRLMHLLFTEDRKLTMNDVNRVRKMMGLRKVSAAEWEAL